MRRVPRGINGCGSKQMLKSEIKHNLFLIKNFMLENREFLFLLLIYRMVMVISPYKKKKTLVKVALLKLFM